VKLDGAWRYSQPVGGGAEQPVKIEFVEIDKPTRLVYDYGPDTSDAPESRAKKP
jgi:uncharacterized protein YndB with AHSA1/START domain